MFSGPKSHLFWRLLHDSQPRRNRLVNLIPVQNVSIKFRDANTITMPALFYATMGGENDASVNHCNEKANTPCSHERPYEVVVAATRDMGIGKDGKLPWNLPSDLRFFKELTTTTIVDGKRNAVIMGRKTWESIPQKYRPLPDRLNVVLTGVGKLATSNSVEDLVICNNFQSALKSLAEPPHSELIEKVFLIGGGQILNEALNGPGCEAIHLTDVEANFECDTFIPRINLSLFRPLFSSSRMVENNIQFSFKTYVRVDNCTAAQKDDLDVDRKTSGFKASSLGNRYAEYDYLKQIHENIAGKKCI